MEFSINTQTIKMELKLQNSNFLKYQELKELLIHTQKLCATACRKIVIEYYLWENKKEDHLKNTGEFLKERDIFGKTLPAYAEDYAKKIIPYLNTGNVATLQNKQTSMWNTKTKKEVINMNAQLATFRDTYPIDIKNDAWEIIKDRESGNYELKINFFSRKAEEYFLNIIKTYESLIINETKNKCKINNKEKATYNQRQLRIYTNILNYIQQNNKLIFVIHRPKGNIKSTLDNIIHYQELIKPYQIEKEKIKKLKDQWEKEEYKKLLDSKTEEIKYILNTPNTSSGGAGQLFFDKKDGKIYFNLAHSFTSNKNNILDTNKILGIDLGIVNIATMQIYNANIQTYEWLNWKEYFIRGDELIAYRQKLKNQGLSEKEIKDIFWKENIKSERKMYANKDTCALDGIALMKVRNELTKRRKDLSIASKWAGEGRCGHGYNTKMKPIDKMRDKIANFRDTYNHKVSKYIIEFAKKNNCGIIQMENLSGFDGKGESLLENWSYYDLQTKVEYKAKAEGIEVKFINPEHTSQRCNKCGAIHSDNRDCKNNQAKFKCMACGHEDNADVNAARNIALPGIDEIISETIKQQKIS